MKRFLIVLFGVLVFFSSSVLGYDFNFEYDDTILASTDLHYGVMKGYYDSITETWFVYIPKRVTGPQSELTIKQFDKFFTELDSDSVSCGGVSGDYCYDDNCNVVVEDERYYSCVGRENDGSSSFLKQYKYYFENQSFVEISSRSNYMTYPYTIATVNRYADADSGNPLVGWDSFIRGDNFIYSIDDDVSDTHNIDIPTEYEGYDSIEALYCNDAYHFLVVKDGVLYDLIYDIEEQGLLSGYGFEYQGVYQIPNNFDTNITVDNWGATTIGDSLYISFVGEQDNISMISLQKWACRDNFQLVESFIEEYNHNEIHHSHNYDTQGISGNSLWYGFRLSTGSIEDLSVNNYYGTVVDGSYAQQSVFDYSMGFDGVNDYVNSGNVLAYTRTQPISLSAWVKTDSSSEMMVVGKYSPTVRGGYKMYLNNGYVYLSKSETNGDTDIARSNVTVNDGEWNNIVGEISGTDNPSNWVFYVNGQLVGTVVVQDQGVGTIVSTNNFTVSSPYYPFDGYIDEVTVWTKMLNSTEVSLLYNELFDDVSITYPYLTRDLSGVYYLFHRVSGDLKVTYEDPCVCGVWVDTTTCDEDLLLQTRTCNPDTCETESEERYIESEYCEKEYNRSQGIYTQNYETWYTQDSCETDWVRVGEGVAECSPPPLTIEPNCINVSSSIEVVPEFDMYHTVYGYSDGCSVGNYHVTSCNPSHDCFEQNYTCQQLNISQNDYYFSYTSGDVVTGKGIMYVDNVCKCKYGLFNFGIREFKIRVSSNVQCQIACENEWVCVNEDYEGLKQIDCSQTNVTFCDYGCNPNDGRCWESENAMIEGTTDRLPDDGNAFNKFVNFFVHPTTTEKFIQGVVGSALIGVILASVIGGLTHKGENATVGFIVGLGLGWILFTFGGYISGVYTVIIIIFGVVAFYLKNK